MYTKYEYTQTQKKVYTLYLFILKLQGWSIIMCSINFILFNNLSNKYDYSVVLNLFKNLLSVLKLTN